MALKHERAFGVQEPIRHFWSAERHSKRVEFSHFGLWPNSLRVMIRHTIFDLFAKGCVWIHILIGVTSLEQEAWRAQVHQVDQAWRVYCCSCIPTTFSSGLLIAWKAAERFYAEGFGFLFDNTSLYCPCVCISLPLSLPFIFQCGCDFKLAQIVYQFCLQLVFIFRTLCVCHIA